MRTETKWAGRVEGWRRSGISATAFCMGKDFSPSGLRYWSSRLRKAGNEAAAKPEVRIARVLRSSEVSEVDTPIVIEVGHARVGVRRGFDRETLRGLLEVLREAGGDQ